MVPLKRKCFARMGCAEVALKSRKSRASFVVGNFDTGTDSPVDNNGIRGNVLSILTVQDIIPVSMLSFIIQSPASKRQSQGTWVSEGSETSYTSPGTSSLDGMDLPNFEMSELRPHVEFYWKESRMLRKRKIIQNPLLNTRTSHSKWDISVRRRRVFETLDLSSLMMGEILYRFGFNDRSTNAKYGD